MILHDFLHIALFNYAFLAGFMVLGWVISLVIKKASIADSIWGPGFVLVAWITLYQVHLYPARNILIAGLVTLWGLRLFTHVTARNMGEPEDQRYARWRTQYGKNFWIVSLFKVFLLQSLFLFAVSLVIQYGLAAQGPSGLTWLDYTGGAVTLFGIFFESAADLQLSRFIKDPENSGKIMDRGLWALSRHPNYFGESCVWWGMFIIVLNVPGGYWTAVSPVLITYTLLKVSGVSLMEKEVFGESDEYRSYRERTSAFIPWFPGKK